jgi:integrase
LNQYQISKAMATTKIILRPDRKKFLGEVGIYIQVCIDSKVKLYPTKNKVLPEYWDAQNQKVRKQQGNKDYIHINNSIDKRREEIKEIIRNATNSKFQITFDYITNELAQLDKPLLANRHKTFYQWLESFIEDQSKEFSKSTAKHNKVLLSHLKTFFGTKQPTFESINYDFYLKYRNWLLAEKDMKNSTVNKQIAMLKTFLRYCSNHKVFDISIIKEFKKLEEKEVENIYITIEELEILWQYDFKDNKRLEKIRDLFVFACATGLRESDFSHINPVNIKGDEIKLQVIKTSKPLTIPLNRYSRAVLKKYDNQLPKYSQQKFNDYIKEVGKMVGLDTLEQIVSYKGGKRIEEILPKYQLMSSHTGRRTFITQSILRGIPQAVIQGMTGHQDLKSFQKYIKINDKDRHEAMKKWEL